MLASSFKVHWGVRGESKVGEVWEESRWEDNIDHDHHSSTGLETQIFFDAVMTQVWSTGALVTMRWLNTIYGSLTITVLYSGVETLSTQVWCEPLLNTTTAWIQTNDITVSWGLKLNQSKCKSSFPNFLDFVYFKSVKHIVSSKTNNFLGTPWCQILMTFEVPRWYQNVTLTFLTFSSD